jgi:hypothetical protein
VNRILSSSAQADDPVFTASWRLLDAPLELVIGPDPLAEHDKSSFIASLIR